MRRSRTPEKEQPPVEAAPAWREASGRVPAHYSTLDIDPSATDKEIQKQYKKLCLVFHPDRQQQQGSAVASNGDPKERFQQIQKAYAVIGDAKLRAEYDAKHGLNLHNRVAMLVATSRVGREPASSSSSGAGAFVPVPVDHAALNDGLGKKKDGGDDEEEDEYEHGPVEGVINVSPSNKQERQQSEKKQQESSGGEKVQMEADGDWAELFGAE